MSTSVDAADCTRWEDSGSQLVSECRCITAISTGSVDGSHAWAPRPGMPFRDDLVQKARVSGYAGKFGTRPDHQLALDAGPMALDSSW